MAGVGDDGTANVLRAFMSAPAISQIIDSDTFH